MKIGIRKFSPKKRIAARLSVKRYIRHSLGFKAPKGAGWLTNPKRAAYNRAYSRKTLGIFRLLFGRSSELGSWRLLIAFVIAFVVLFVFMFTVDPSEKNYSPTTQTQPQTQIQQTTQDKEPPPPSPEEQIRALKGTYNGNKMVEDPNAAKIKQFHSDNARFREINRQITNPESTTPNGTSFGTNSYNKADGGTNSRNKTVHVQGYTRKDGTYVESYKRSPRSD